MAKYRILHKTTYSYRYPVTVSHHAARLQPISNQDQSCDSFRLSLNPESSDLIERKDYFGNAVQLFSIQEPHVSFVANASSVVEVTRQSIDLSSIDTPTQALRQALADIARTDLVDAKQFLYETELTRVDDDILAFGERFLADDAPIGPAILDMLAAFKDEFAFDPVATDIYTPIQEVLRNKRGVCQDFAHLMLGALRAQGLAACYASGYILTSPPPGQERLVGADASHAWVSIYIPEHGWVDVDPTNNLVCSSQHVVVAYGRDFSDVSMLKGAVTGGGDHTVAVEVTMLPMGE